MKKEIKKLSDLIIKITDEQIKKEDDFTSKYLAKKLLKYGYRDCSEELKREDSYSNGNLK